MLSSHECTACSEMKWNEINFIILFYNNLIGTCGTFPSNCLEGCIPSEQQGIIDHGNNICENMFTKQVEKWSEKDFSLIRDSKYVYVFGLLGYTATVQHGNLRNAAEPDHDVLRCASLVVGFVCATWPCISEALLQLLRLLRGVSCAPGCQEPLTQYGEYLGYFNISWSRGLDKRLVEKDYRTTSQILCDSSKVQLWCRQDPAR